MAEIEEAEEETAEPAELTASDLMAEAEADAVAVQGIPEPSVERWDAEGRFGAGGALSWNSTALARAALGGRGVRPSDLVLNSI